jgi:hypothetical protein
MTRAPSWSPVEERRCHSSVGHRHSLRQPALRVEVLPGERRPRTAGRGQVRLLLRVPDLIHRVGQQVKPCDPAARSRRRGGASVAILQMCNVWVPMYRQATEAAERKPAGPRSSLPPRSRWWRSVVDARVVRQAGPAEPDRLRGRVLCRRCCTRPRHGGADGQRCQQGEQRRHGEGEYRQLERSGLRASPRSSSPFTPSPCDPSAYPRPGAKVGTQRHGRWAPASTVR